jgi:hypothetical protein
MVIEEFCKPDTKFPAESYTNKPARIFGNRVLSKPNRTAFPPAWARTIPINPQAASIPVVILMNSLDQASRRGGNAIILILS